MDSLLDSSCLGQLGVSPPSGLQVAAQDKQSVFARLGGSCGCSRHPGGVVMQRLLSRPMARRWLVRPLLCAPDSVSQLLSSFTPAPSGGSLF